MNVHNESNQAHIKSRICASLVEKWLQYFIKYVGLELYVQFSAKTVTVNQIKYVQNYGGRWYLGSVCIYRTNVISTTYLLDISLQTWK